MLGLLGRRPVQLLRRFPVVFNIRADHLPYSPLCPPMDARTCIIGFTVPICSSPHFRRSPRAPGSFSFAADGHQLSRNIRVPAEKSPPPRSSKSSERPPALSICARNFRDLYGTKILIPPAAVPSSEVPAGPFFFSLFPPICAVSDHIGFPQRVVLYSLKPFPALVFCSSSSAALQDANLDHGPAFFHLSTECRPAGRVFAGPSPPLGVPGPCLFPPAFAGRAGGEHVAFNLATPTHSSPLDNENFYQQLAPVFSLVSEPRRG